MDKDNRFLLRELQKKPEERKPVEDAYSAAYMEDPDDEGFLTAEEQGFMLGYLS